MRATDFEFRHRFWFIVLVFVLGFGCYAIQPVNSVEWLYQLLGRPTKVAGIVPAGVASRAILVFGTLLILAGALLRTWGTAYLNNQIVRDDVVRAERLVADGPYRYVRNPLYLGNVLLATGLGPLASPIGWFILVAGTIFVVLRLIGREEPFLLEKQGDAYRAYLERVPRLWPALRPRLPSGGTEPRWGQSWLAEMWLWILFAASAVFDATLNARLLDYIVWIGFAVYFPLRILMKRRSARLQA
jgi:protein-S-isoprenylcysteine O-methyltransferase Ste14